MTLEGRPEVLFVSEGFVLDELAEMRLRHQLRRAPETVVAVAAAPEPLLAGASFKAFAARRLVNPRATLRPAVGPHLRGAVLARSSGDLEHDGDLVSMSAAGTVLVDSGAHVHDMRPDGRPIEIASPQSRSPFRQQPMVVFLAVDKGAERVEWAQTLANELIMSGFEACVSADEVTADKFLSRPCAPAGASLGALRPDAVVALDESALRRAHEWMVDDRNAVVIGFSSVLSESVSLVSWRLGRAQGRLRARVGPDVESGVLADLVRRLCSGPNVLPPSGRPATASARELYEGAGVMLAPIRRRSGSDRTLRKPSVSVLCSAVDSCHEPRLVGLADRLEAAGCRVEVATYADEALPGSDVVILHRVSPSSELARQIDRRAETRSPTVVHLDRSDVERGSADLRLTTESARVVRACGLTIAPTRTVADLAEREGVRVVVLPMFLSRPQERLLRSTGSGPPEPLVDWLVESTSESECDAVTQALTRVMDDKPELSLSLSGARSGRPRFPSRFDRRIRRQQVFDPEASSRLSLRVWTGDVIEQELDGDVLPLVEAAFVGVPTVVASANPVGGVTGHPRSLLVADQEDADAWLDRILPLFDAAVRRRVVDEALRSADVLYGFSTADLAVQRFLGWLYHRSVHDG